MTSPLTAVDAERELVAAMFIAHPDDLPRVLEHIRPSEWTDEKLATIARSIQSLHHIGSAVDLITVKAALVDAGMFEFIGGQAGFGAACNRYGTTDNVAHYARIVSEKARLRRVLKLTRDVSSQLSQADDPDEAIEQAGKLLTQGIEAERPKTKIKLQTLGERAAEDSGWLTTMPPKADALVTWQDGQSQKLCIPAGRVGILAAPGGTGKSFALVDLALSVATGQPWLGHFDVPAKGKVLLALGEEDEAELMRRTFAAAQRYNGSHDRDYLLGEASRNLVPMPMMGRDVGLVGPDREPSAWFTEFRDSIKHVPWRLIVLDPLSRWGGQDIETDAHAATRCIQLLEQLTQLPGNPAVIVAHHTNKAALGDGAERNQGVVRGHSALVDGARWVGLLEAVKNPSNAMRLKMSVVKSNYGAKPRTVDLIRDRGLLRVMNGAELDAERSEKEASPVGEWRGRA
jgi:hypothetical protein